MSYPVLCGAVVLTSANNRLRFREAAGAVGNVDLDVGTYYLRGGYTTNLVAQSENLVAWGPPAAITITPNAIESPSGSTACLVDLTSPGSSTGIAFVVSYTGNGTKTISLYLRRGIVSPSSITDIDAYDSTAIVDRHIVRVTWGSDGVPTLSSVAGSGTRFAPVSVGNGWGRIALTADNIVAANSNSVNIYPAGIPLSSGSVFAWGVQAENATTPGLYVKTTGSVVTGPTDDLAYQIKTKLDAFGVGGNTYDITMARNIDPASPHSAMTIARTSGTSTFGLVVDGSQTFDMALIGFPASTLNDALAKTSIQACAANWACNDIAREIEPVSERVVAVPRAVSGRVQGVTRSARMQSWRLGLAFVDERRMLVERAFASAQDTLEGFIERFGAGASVEAYEASVSTGSTLSTIALSSLIDVVHFSEDALSRFEPVRIGPGVPLYSLDLRLHAKV